jgi:hypothetical protein
MQVRYTLHAQSHEFDLSDSEDLAVMCPEIEDRIRGAHPELTNRSFLAERVADALLNNLADDAAEIDLGDISDWGR